MTKKLLVGVIDMIFNFIKNYQPGIIGISDKECPHCSTLLSEVQDSGILGCSQCHETFGSELQYFFTQNKSEEEIKEENNKREALTVQLQNAIKEENYEQAATLRDQLKLIK